MNRFLLIICLCAFTLLSALTEVKAGNPDRQGEAGAYELLMNPWARSAGLHTMNTSFVSGVEAMRLNIAGLSRVTGTEVLLSHGIYLDGAGVNMTALGLAQPMGKNKNGALGISLMGLDFGDIPVTTTLQPEGTGATFSPAWFHIGIGYSHTFENKVSVGFLFRGVFQSTADVSASGAAIDAGVQYVTGPQDNFKIGISLRNIGTKMKFGGEALNSQFIEGSNDSPNRRLTFRTRAQGFDLPSVLNLGISYDFIIASDHRITVLGNFAANSFSRDELGGGIEYGFKDLFMVRGGYKAEAGQSAEGFGDFGDPIYTGLSAGASIMAPLGKKQTTKLGFDYAWRATNPFNGTHNFTVRLIF